MEIILSHIQRSREEQRIKCQEFITNFMIIRDALLVAIVSFLVYSKLENKLDGWGKAEEAKKKEQREVFVKTASAEEIAKLEKKEKKDGILTTVGVIISIIIVIPTMASIFILGLMHM